MGAKGKPIFCGLRDLETMQTTSWFAKAGAQEPPLLWHPNQKQLARIPQQSNRGPPKTDTLAIFCLSVAQRCLGKLVGAHCSLQALAFLKWVCFNSTWGEGGERLPKPVFGNNRAPRAPCRNMSNGRTVFWLSIVGLLVPTKKVIPSPSKWKLPILVLWGSPKAISTPALRWRADWEPDSPDRTVGAPGWDSPA